MYNLILEFGTETETENTSTPRVTTTLQPKHSDSVFDFFISPHYVGETET